MNDNKLIWLSVPSRDSWVREMFLDKDRSKYKSLYLTSCWDLAVPDSDVTVEHYPDGRTFEIPARQTGKTQRQRDMAAKVDLAIKRGELYFR